MKMTVVLALVCVTVGLSVAQESDAAIKQYDLNIPRQTLDTALKDLAQQTGLQIARFTDNGHGSAMVGPVQGAVTAETALDSLLAPTGLTYRVVNDRTIAVMAPGSGTPVAAAGSAEGEGGSDPGNARTAGAGRIAQNQTGVQQSQASQPNERESQREKRPIEEIVVTGTNIRGIAPESSPVRIFDREDIQISGAATAQEFIKMLPQNFGGGSNPNIPGALGNDVSAGGNAGGFGSFGSSINLRGLGSGSTLVLLNGHRVAPSSNNADFTDISMIPASAIERVETLTDGASSIYGSDAVAGVVNFILRDDFDGLETSLRYGTGTQNGTPDQYRTSVTRGQNWDSGHALLVYEFFTQDQLSVEDRNFAAKEFLPNYLLPSQKRHSVLASASQNVAPNLELFADFNFSTRRSRHLRTLFMQGSTRQHDTSSDNANMFAGGVWKVASDWYFDFSGAYSQLGTRTRSSIDADRRRATDSEIWTADVKLSGTLFHSSGGDVKVAFGGHFRTESFLAVDKITDTIDREAARDVYALFGETFIPIVGSENRIPGIERLELNASGRFSDYSDFGSTANPKIGLLWSPVDGLNLRGSYSTSFKAPPLGRVGSSDFTAWAFRTSFINALLGLTSPDPSLDDAVFLTLTGTSNELEPETSRAFTAGLDFYQQWAAHDLAFSATWFDIDFEGRLGTTPIPGNIDRFGAVNIAFTDPNAFPEGAVVFSPTANEISALLDSVDRFSNPFGDDPFDAVALNFTGVIRNLSRSIVSGFDFDVSYAYDLGGGSLLLGFDGTFLRDYKIQAATTSPVVEQVNTLFNPVDLKLRGRAGYSGDYFNGNIFLNYVDSYSVDSTPGSAPIGSWTTVDISLAYDTTLGLENSLLDNTVFRFSAINVFNEDPPQAPIFSTFPVDGFDPTNASPLGRFIAFEVTKRW